MNYSITLKNQERYHNPAGPEERQPLGSVKIYPKAVYKAELETSQKIFCKTLLGDLP